MSAVTMLRISADPDAPEFIGHDACQGGASGYCAQLGRHDLCAHRPGGAHESGSWAPSTVLLRGHGKAARVLIDATTGRSVDIGPWHVWHCSCACHTAPQQVGLLF